MYVYMYIDVDLVYIAVPPFPLLHISLLPPPFKWYQFLIQFGLVEFWPVQLCSALLLNILLCVVAVVAVVCCLLFVAVVDVVEPLDSRNAQIKQKKQIWSSTAIIKLLFLLFITLLNKWSFGSDVN